MRAPPKEITARLRPDYMIPFDTAKAMADVLDERLSQLEHGFDAAHDDAEHGDGAMGVAALHYVAGAVALTVQGVFDGEISGPPPLTLFRLALAWPFGRAWWRPNTARAMLVKAAALILAEIERIDRVSAKEGGAA